MIKQTLLTLSLGLGMVVCGCAQDVKAILRGIAEAKPKEQVQVMVLGSIHFGQESYYKDNPKADLLSEQGRRAVAEVNRRLRKFNPDMIMVEQTPEEQPALDSLYALYKGGKLQLSDIPHGRAERYQFGYQLAKTLGLERIYGVDYYESVSNRMLQEGDNVEIFKSGFDRFNEAAKAVDTGFKEGRVSLRDYLLFINNPEFLDLAYQVLLVNPSRVKNGKFLNPPVQYVDTSYVNKQYIGAEYISVFYERDLKIYSNIVTAQMKQKGKRLLVVMGARHAAILTEIFGNDPQYKVVNPKEYLD